MAHNRHVHGEEHGAHERHEVAHLDAEVIERDEAHAHQAQQRRGDMPLGDALLEQNERDERYQDAVGSGEERVLARGGVDQAERLRGIGRPDHATHEHAKPQVLAVEVRLDALAEDDEHDDRRQQEATGEQHERGDRIQHGLHGQEGITPDERHRDEHELPKQRRAGAGASKLSRSAVLRRDGYGVLACERIAFFDTGGGLCHLLLNHGLQLSPRLAFSLIAHTGPAGTGVFPGATLMRALHRTHVLYGFDGGDVIPTLAIDAGHPGSSRTRAWCPHPIGATRHHIVLASAPRRDKHYHTLYLQLNAPR